MLFVWQYIAQLPTKLWALKEKSSNLSGKCREAQVSTSSHTLKKKKKSEDMFCGIAFNSSKSSPEHMSSSLRLQTL